MTHAKRPGIVRGMIRRKDDPRDACAEHARGIDLVGGDGLQAGDENEHGEGKMLINQNGHQRREGP